MILSEGQINAIVDRVVRQLSPELREVPQAPVPHPAGPAAVEPIRPRAAPASTSTSGALDGVFEDLEAAIGAAVQSFERWSSVPLEGRARAIEAMREATRKYAEELSRLAVEETGLGNVKDKIAKNLLCANKTPGIEILRPQAFTGDHGMTLDERAPFGVIGAITPSTNPTETIINNALGMVAAGNSVSRPTTDGRHGRGSASGFRPWRQARRSQAVR